MLGHYPFRAYAIVKSISAPFNAGRHVEVKWKLEDGSGEITRRVPADDAAQYHLNQVCALSMMPV